MYQNQNLDYIHHMEKLIETMINLETFYIIIAYLIDNNIKITNNLKTITCKREELMITPLILLPR